MDLNLEAIVLHNSLYGCLALRGMGTGIIEAKLVQQLAHLEQRPFFGIFIDLWKALMPWIGAAASRYWCYMWQAHKCSISSATSGTWQ